MQDSRSVVCIVCVLLCNAAVHGYRVAVTAAAAVVHLQYMCSPSACRNLSNVCRAVPPRCACDVPLLLVHRVFWMYDVYSFAFGVIVVAQGIE